jgi:hypothetical protein
MTRNDPGIPAVRDRGCPGQTPARPKIVMLYQDIREATSQHVGALIDRIRGVTRRVSQGADTADFAPP